jgi:hypothetical protein
LKIDPLKYAFGVSARKFFGLIIHDKGIEIDPKKIETVKKVRNLHAKGICRNF